MTAPNLYTSNIQKGGALLDVAARFVAAWDEHRSPEENWTAAAEVNVVGAASAVRRSDLSRRILHRRFIEPGPHVMTALKVLVDSDNRAFRDACYFETTRAEPLLAAFAEGPLFGWFQSGRSTISLDDATTWLTKIGQAGQAPPWSEAVRTRVGRALLAALRDFGILDGIKGGMRKVIARPYPSVAGFTYVCWRLHELGVTAATIVSSPSWRRWLLEPADVTGLLADLAQQGVILLNRAGSVTRIEWQANTLAEAVHAAA